MLFHFTKSVKITFSLLFLFILISYTLNFIFLENKHIIEGDGLGYYVHLRSILIEGDFDYENDFRDYKYGPAPAWKSTTETIHVLNPYPIGLALLWLPFFLFAHLFTFLINLVGFNFALDGYSVFYQFFIGLGSMIYGFLGLFFIFKIGIKFFSEKIVLISITFFILAGNILYYFIIGLSMSHLISMFLVSFFIYYWLSTYKRKGMKEYFYLGLLSGMIVLTRYQDGLFISLLFCDLFEKKFNFKSIMKSLSYGLIAFSTFIIAISPQVILLRIIHGVFTFFPYGLISNEWYFNFFQPHFFETLFSPRQGLISWTPIILFCLAGLYFFIKKNHKIGIFFLFLFLFQWYLNSAWNIWWFGASFGARAFISCSPIFVIGLSSLLDYFVKRKNLFNLLLIIFTVLSLLNFIFILQYQLSMFQVINIEPTCHEANWLEIIKNIPKLISRLFIF